jgi:hypothetical protein
MNKISSFSRTVICFTVLLVLVTLHVVPLPIPEVFILFVMVVRPRGFKNLVDQFYERYFNRVIINNA